LDALQREHERQRAADQGLLSDEARGRILSLAKEFRRIWNDSHTAPIERKRMVALLIEDVTLTKADKVAIHVRTSLTIDKPRPVALIRKTLPEVVCTVDELLETCTDRQVAARLNELGYRNWKGQTLTVKKVTVIRMAYRLRSRFERLRGRGMLTGDELAKQLGVCTTTVHQWGRAGLLRRQLYGNNHRCLYEPIDDVVVINARNEAQSSTQSMLPPYCQRSAGIKHQRRARKLPSLGEGTGSGKNEWENGVQDFLGGADSGQESCRPPGPRRGRPAS